MKPKQSGTANREKLDSYYTCELVINEIVSNSIFREMINDVKCVVDCSAGDDKFINEVKKQFVNDSEIKTWSFDINPNADTVVKKDWFDVNELPDKYILGLKPPFGRQSSLIRKFINHALQINPPAAIVMVHPVKDTIIPSGYEELQSYDLKPNSFIRSKSGGVF
jgi:hypothetical protein